MAKKTSSRTKSTPETDAPAAPAPTAKATAAKAAAPKAAAPKAAAPKAAVKKAAPKKSVPAQKATPVSAEAEPSDEDIRVRAYHRYLERGGGHGMDFEDWLEAKRELQKMRG